jgi:phosphatidate cytidylyltransferase
MAGGSGASAGWGERQVLKKRVITALWGVPLVLLAIWFDKPLSWFTVLAVVWGLLAAVEFQRITGVARTRPLAVFGLAWTLLFIIYPHLPDGLTLPLLLSSAVVLSLALLLFLPKKDGLFTGWAWTLGGILYIGWLLGLLVALRLEAGRNWVFLALLATFGSDTAAYFIGRAFGRHKMAPHISPGKTWEGAAGGLMGAVVVSLLFTLSTSVQLPLGYGEAVLLGMFISIFGQVGDLAESLLKRSSGVKESGGLLPGHGGLLDRLDSILFAGAVVYAFYFLVIG